MTARSHHTMTSMSDSNTGTDAVAFWSSGGTVTPTPRRGSLIAHTTETGPSYSRPPQDAVMLVAYSPYVARMFRADQNQRKLGRDVVLGDTKPMASSTRSQGHSRSLSGTISTPDGPSFASDVRSPFTLLSSSTRNSVVMTPYSRRSCPETPGPRRARSPRRRPWATRATGSSPRARPAPPHELEIHNGLAAVSHRSPDASVLSPPPITMTSFLLR